MATDPSWLYSTIAQSSAAIVAIIGGFITSTVLSLSAQKNSLKNQLKDNKTTLEEYKTKNISDPALEIGIPVLQKRIKNFSYPQHLGWGMLVLSFLAFFSIIFPVFALLEEWFFIWIKILAFALFGIGILGVFMYITLEIKRLGRK
jgi:hypothetical protein